MDSPPDDPSSDFSYLRLPSLGAGAPSLRNPALLAWALQNYQGPLASGSDDASAPSSPSSAPIPAQSGPVASEGDLPPTADATTDFQFGRWNPQVDPAPIQPGPISAPDIRYRIARPRDSISTLLGTNDPAAIGQFMQVNGLRSSLIRAGDVYRLPDPNAPRLDGATALGLSARKADEARRAAFARSSGTRPAASQGIWVDGTFYPPNQMAAAAAALAQPSPKIGVSSGTPGPLPSDHLRPLSPWEVWTTNVSNRQSQAEQTLDSARDFFDQRSVLNSPVRNAVLTAEGLGREAQGVQQGLFAVPSGVLDTVTSLARGEGPWASPSIQRDTDFTTGVASLAGSLFDPQFAQFGPAGLADLRTGPYGALSKELRGSGLQAHHLNQDAAYGDIIPREDGFAVGMRGNALRDVGSQHYEFHSSLEGFWSPYRDGGALEGSMPTNMEYDAAVKQALIRSGHTPARAKALAAEAARQRRAYGLKPSDSVPRVPNRLPQRGRS